MVIVKALLKFIETDEFSGNLKAPSFFPQYLIKAILAGAVAVAFIQVLELQAKRRE